MNTFNDIELCAFKKPIYENGHIKCPECGEYLIGKDYNNLCPEQLAGAAGTIYTCPKCKYWYDDIKIIS